MDADPTTTAAPWRCRYGHPDCIVHPGVEKKATAARRVWRWLTDSHDPIFGWPILSWLCWAVCLGILIGTVTGLYDVGHSR